MKVYLVSEVASHVSNRLDKQVKSEKQLSDLEGMYHELGRCESLCLDEQELNTLVNKYPRVGIRKGTWDKLALFTN